MAKKTSFALTFVPQSTGKGPDDRKFINSHLSRLATERRKAGKTGVKSLVVLPAQSAKVKIPRRGSAAENQEIQSPDDNQSSSPVLSSLETTDDPDEVQLVTTSRPGNFTILDDGNPDPFASTLIPVTQAVQALFAFNSDVFLPWTSRTEKEGVRTIALPKRFFWRSSDAAIDRTVGYAHLARLGAVASTITANAELAKAALEYSSHAYQSLREYLVANEKRPNHLLYGQIFSLFSMEIAKQNHEAATVHARTIQQLMRSATPNGQEYIMPEPYLLNAILWHEQQRLLMSLRKPEFEIDAFPNASRQKQVLAELKEKLKRDGFWPQRLRCGFQQANLDSKVKAGLGELHEHWAILVALKSAGQTPTEEFMTAFAHRTTSNMGTLITLYNKNKTPDSDKQDQSETMKQRAGAAACLAARYWFRCACLMETPDSGPPVVSQVGQVYGRYAMILGPVRMQCEAALQEAMSLDTNDLALWLWILYVGTLAERARDNYCRCREDYESDRFFHRSFTKLAWYLILLTWQQVENVLNPFFYEASVGPQSVHHFVNEMKRIEALQFDTKPG